MEIVGRKTEKTSATSRVIVDGVMNVKGERTQVEISLKVSRLPQNNVKERLNF